MQLEDKFTNEIFSHGTDAVKVALREFASAKLRTQQILHGT